MQYYQNFLVVLRFLGTNYHGWQIQKNALSIQEVFQSALFKVIKHKTDIKACSRTDSGVHANKFCVNFKTNISITPKNLIFAINRFLPSDVRVIDCMKVPENFHARYSCTKKEYIYKIYNHKVMDPFMYGRSFHFWYPIDLNLINNLCKVFLGYHDFTAFCSLDARAKINMFRNINYLAAEKNKNNENIIEFKIQADGFLYNMVRIIVGTLLKANYKKMNCFDIKNVLESKNRALAGDTLPACGLYLNRIFYGELII